MLIVGAKSQRFGTVGTGVLFQVADACFVVTSAHVIRDAVQNTMTVGINADCKHFMALPGKWIMIDLASCVGFEDPVDVAIYRLDSHQLSMLWESTFVRMTEVGQPRTDGIYTIFGYPGILTGKVKGADDTLQRRALALTLPAYQGKTPELHNFNPKYAFLLPGNSDLSTDSDGEPMLMSDLDPSAENTLRDLKGMSGGPVWLVATSGSDPATWNRDMPRLVGVQIGFFKRNDVLRITKWDCVLDIIRLSFPELGRALDLTR